jgi:hypothetical protein
MDIAAARSGRLQWRLNAERFSLCGDYYRLKDETRSVEIVRKGAENIMRGDGRDRRQMAQGMEL